MKNKLELIHTPDYVLAVSDEEIREGWGIYFNEPTPTIEYLKNEEIDWNEEYGWSKIIAYQPKHKDVPKLDLPLIPEMVVQDDLENQIENYLDVTEHYIELDDSGRRKYNDHYVTKCIKEFTEVYYKPASEETLRKVFEHGILFKEMSVSTCTDAIDAEFVALIKFLKQPKQPKYFIAEETVKCSAEITEPCLCKEKFGHTLKCRELKTTTNSDNEIVLVGTYE
jgi:hypothetical protein